MDPTYQFVSARLGLPLLGLLRSSEPITLIMQSQTVDGQRLLQSSISVLVHTLLSEQNKLGFTKREMKQILSALGLLVLLVPQKEL